MSKINHLSMRRRENNSYFYINKNNSYFKIIHISIDISERGNLKLQIILNVFQEKFSDIPDETELLSLSI